MYSLDNILKYSSDEKIVSHGNVIFIGDEKKSVFVNQLISDSGKDRIDSLLTTVLKDTISNKYNDVEEVYSELGKGADSFIVYSSDISPNEDPNKDDFYKRKNYIMLHLGKVKTTPINNANKYFFQTERMTQKNIKQSSFLKEAAGHEIWVHDKPVSYEEFGITLEIVWFRNAIPSNKLNIVNVKALNDLKNQKNEISKEIKNSVDEVDPELLKKEQQIDDLIEEFKVDAGFDKSGFEDIIKSNYTKKEIIPTNEILSFNDDTLKDYFVSKYFEGTQDDVDIAGVHSEEEITSLIDNLQEEIKSQVEKLKSLDFSEETSEEKETVKTEINKNKELLEQYYKELDNLQNKNNGRTPEII